ncbi:hypothetical protein HYV50_01720 [Candidatus Pacearchaeota archaeon]|nr:hypothetical protein [Candidatus Pacearchaeota archaeon]
MKNEEVIIIILAVVLALFLFSSLSGFGMMSYLPGYRMMSGFSYGFMPIFAWLFMLLVVIALVLLIAWLVKQLQKK